jgi:hypothetical protein
MPTGLKITNVMDQTLYNSTLFAGVEDDDDNNNKYNNNEDDDDANNDNNADDEQTQVTQVNDEMHPDNMEHGFKRQHMEEPSINEVEADEEEEEEDKEDNIEL